MRLRPKHWIVGALAVAAIVLSLSRLEGARAGIGREALEIGTTPATLYRLPGDEARRLVVVSHGFAGSRQIMEALSLTLARAGHAVLAFDYAGHGRNTEPMRGDVDSIDGTTRQLIDETRAVIDAGLALPGVTGPVAIVGHSMATDVIVRAALEDDRIEDVVAVSMFPNAVTATAPASLLAVNGAWEPHLRAASVESLRLVDPLAGEGQTATAGDVRRRVVAAPGVEHVGVLYHAVTLTEARDWLGASDTPVADIGLAVAGLLVGVVALAWPLSKLMPGRRVVTPVLPARKFAIAVLAPAAIAPFIATQIRVGALPVLVADYLVVHFAILGIGQLLLARAYGLKLPPVAPLALAALIVWGIGVYGLSIDRYAASFWPTGMRWGLVVVLALGTLPLMLADAVLSDAGHAWWLRRMTLKLALIASLALAVALDTERLVFLLFILPVILLFFIVFGFLGRWTGSRSSASTAGIGLGVIFAWTLAVSFPLFVA